MLDVLRENFRSLAGCPRELWLVYLLKFLESYGYFSLSMLLILYLVEEFGLVDVEAGTYYGLLGGVMGAVAFAIGLVVDSLGVRLSLLLGAVVKTVSLLVLALTRDLRMVQLVLFLLLPIGSSLGIPVMSMGIKRYTTARNRGFAFGVFYAVQNLAALSSGLLIDLIEIQFQSGIEVFGAHYSPRRIILISGSLCSAIGIAIAAFVREVKVGESDKVESVTVRRSSPPELIAELRAKPDFWRFMGITVVCINLRMIFRYVDALLPAYLVREFGPSVPKGSISAINAAMIIPLVPIVAAVTSGRIHFDMIRIGGYISALSALPLALFTTIPASVAFVVILSLGEAIWSPRFYDLTVSMAPEGREGIFVAMGAAPLFVAKFPAGIFSGYLLDTYCPTEGPRSPQTLWLIVCCMTLSSPLAMSVFQKWLRPPASADEARQGFLDIRGSEDGRPKRSRGASPRNGDASLEVGASGVRVRAHPTVEVAFSL